MRNHLEKSGEFHLEVLYSGCKFFKLSGQISICPDGPTPPLGQRPHSSGIRYLLQHPFSVFHNSITEIFFVAKWAVSTFLKIFGLTIVIFSSTTSEQKSRVKQWQESQWQNPTPEETTIFSLSFDFLGITPPPILLRLVTVLVDWVVGRLNTLMAFKTWQTGPGLLDGTEAELAIEVRMVASEDVGLVDLQVLLMGRLISLPILPTNFTRYAGAFPVVVVLVLKELPYFLSVTFFTSMDFFSAVLTFVGQILLLPLSSITPKFPYVPTPPLLLSWSVYDWWLEIFPEQGSLLLFPAHSLFSNEQWLEHWSISCLWEQPLASRHICAQRVHIFQPIFTRPILP